MNNKKYAVFTIDVEAFTDTECVNNSPTDIQDDLLDGLDEYIKILDQHSIKGTLFTVGELAPKISSRLKNYINQGHNLALHNLKQTLKEFFLPTLLVSELLALALTEIDLRCFVNSDLNMIQVI